MPAGRRAVQRFPGGSGAVSKVRQDGDRGERNDEYEGREREQALPAQGLFPARALDLSLSASYAGHFSGNRSLLGEDSL